MELSIIIPAFNEEKELPGCLASVDEATAAVADNHQPKTEFEVVVADNNSTDATAALAQAAGARIVFEPVNQISRARNAGASAATGDWLLFIDADSRLHPRSLEDLLGTIYRGGVAGGGCLVALDRCPPSAIPVLGLWNLISRSMRWAAGSFVFCRADAFRDLGGFSLELYASEEIEFSRRLKRWSKARGLKVVILKAQRHVSSARKAELYSRWELLRQGCRLLCQLRRTVRDRSRLEVYYDGRR